MRWKRSAAASSTGGCSMRWGSIAQSQSRDLKSLPIPRTNYGRIPGQWDCSNTRRLEAGSDCGHSVCRPVALSVGEFSGAGVSGMGFLASLAVGHSPHCALDAAGCRRAVGRANRDRNSSDSIQHWPSTSMVRADDRNSPVLLRGLRLRCSLAPENGAPTTTGSWTVLRLAVLFGRDILR